MKRFTAIFLALVLAWVEFLMPAPAVADGGSGKNPPSGCCSKPRVCCCVAPVQVPVPPQPAPIQREARANSVPLLLATLSVALPVAKPVADSLFPSDGPFLARLASIPLFQRDCAMLI